MEAAGVKMARYFGTIIGSRDYTTDQHARRVGMITYVLIEKVKRFFPEYGLTDEDVRMISSAAAVHDVGKLILSDRIVKKSNRLTDAEYETYKTHTYKGHKMFTDTAKLMPKTDPDKAFFELCAEICLNHHERYNGDGYPEGKKKDEIPVAAQVVGLADEYEDALSDRIYKKGASKLEVYDMIMSGECGSFSPKLLRVFQEARPELEELMTKEGL